MPPTGDEIARLAETMNLMLARLEQSDATTRRFISDASHELRSPLATIRAAIEVSPSGCRRFCRDECLAISMVAACQHSSCPAFRACAVALLGSNEIEEAIDCADGFARRLKEANQMLSPGSVFMGAGLLTADVKGHG